MGADPPSRWWQVTRLILFCKRSTDDAALCNPPPPSNPVRLFVPTASNVSGAMLRELSLPEYLVFGE